MLADRLIHLREEKKLTRKEIAEHLKIDQSTYGKYELGKREPDNDTLNELADFFNVTTDYLLGRSNSRSTSESNIETKAYHNIDTSGLPEEDILKVEEYVELLKKKYNPDGTIRGDKK